MDWDGDGVRGYPVHLDGPDVRVCALADPSRARGYGVAETQSRSCRPPAADLAKGIKRGS